MPAQKNVSHFPSAIRRRRRERSVAWASPRHRDSRQKKIGPTVGLDECPVADNLSDMKTNLRTFQREFGRMRRLAAKGVPIRIHAKRETFVFAKEAAPHGLLGCCAGLMDASKLTTAPIVAEWHAAR